MYKNKMKIDGKERLSIVDRTKLFTECLTFYKFAVADKSMLRKELTVEFSQALGIDAGDVKVEMLVSFYKQALTEMFDLVDGLRYMPRVVHYYCLSYLVFQFLTLFTKWSTFSKFD